MSSRKTRRCLSGLVVAGLVLVPACGDSDEGSEQASAPPTAPPTVKVEEDPVADEGEGFTNPEEIDYMGSVTDPEGAFVLYPDGLKVEVVGVKSMPVQFSNADPGHDTEVHVTVRLSNEGNAPVQLWDGDVKVETLL